MAMFFTLKTMEIFLWKEVPS